MFVLNLRCKEHRQEFLVLFVNFSQSWLITSWIKVNSETLALVGCPQEARRPISPPDRPISRKRQPTLEVAGVPRGSASLPQGAATLQRGRDIPPPSTV